MSADAGPPIIEIHNVSRRYVRGVDEIHALENVSLSIQRGRFVAFMGPSGSGKSTLMNLVSGIDRPDEGDILVVGQRLNDYDEDELAQWRARHVGIIFQSFNLIPVLNVWENIEFPLLLGDSRDGRKERREWIDFLIQEVGLTQWKTHRPNELSGGQRQRVAIARALVTRPPLVLADEPTANLDSKTGEQIIMLMKKINGELDTTFVFSTHDAKIISAADHVIKLEDGRVIENTRADAPRQAVAGSTEARA